MSVETIFALSSGAGIAGVAVIRISGPLSFDVLTGLTGKKLPEARRAVLRKLYAPETGEILDQALVLLFKAPNSFTGQDSVELHIHGGTAVIDGVLDAIRSFDGVTMAEAGAFTRQAFEAGKLDLTEVEGLGDLIHAQTPAQRFQALKQMDGALSNLYEGWRSVLVSSLAHLEADIDFSDEDLPEGLTAAVRPRIEAVYGEIEAHLAEGTRGIALREGYKIAIVGAPNAGKSSLLNKLAKSDVAIVTEEAGTTRDVLEVSLNLGGFPVRLMDTAGIREGDIGRVEREGIRRAVERADEADLCLILLRADMEPPISPALLPLLDKNSLVLVSQTDRVSGEDEMFHVKHQDYLDRKAQTIPFSIYDQASLEKIITVLTNHVVEALGQRESLSFTRLRHKDCLEEAMEGLSRFFQAATIDAVLAAEDLRLAARSIGKLTGRVDVEDILDIIFSDFCIGK